MVIGDLESVEKIIPQQRPLGVTSQSAPADLPKKPLRQVLHCIFLFLKYFRLVAKPQDIPQEHVMKMTNVGALKMTTIFSKMSGIGLMNLTFQMSSAIKSTNLSVK